MSFLGNRDGAACVGKKSGKVNIPDRFVPTRVFVLPGNDKRFVERLGEVKYDPRLRTGIRVYKNDGVDIGCFAGTTAERACGIICSRSAAACAVWSGFFVGVFSAPAG